MFLQSAKMKTKLCECLALGHVMMDRRFSNSMLPWLLREIRSLKVKDRMSIVIEDGFLKAFNENFEPVIVHRLVDIIRASQVPGKPEELFYIYYSEKESLLYCYLFAAASDTEVSELFSQMRESPGGSRRGSAASLQQTGAVTSNVGFSNQNHAEHLPWSSAAVPQNCNTNLTSEVSTPPIRSVSNASALTSLCVDLSPSDSHFFEVLYIGKVRISQRRVPESLIDDALFKFAQHEAEKARTLRRHSLLSSTGTSLYSCDSGEDINEKNTNITNNDANNIIRNNITVASTPLQPEKSWKSTDLLNQNKDKTNEVDQEFEAFTKERVEKNGHIKKLPSPTPLEPSILILNVPSKNNLCTLAEDEERNEDIRSVISETASSITQFCQANLVTDKTEANLLQNKSVKPFPNDVEDEKTINKSEAVDLNITEVDKSKDTRSLESLKNTRQDSPAPLNFQELPMKSKKFLRSNSGFDCFEKRIPDNNSFLRDRSASIGTLSLKTPIAQVLGEQNRTMLFQVGRSELRLISPDRKQVLLHRAFKDVASCVLGRVNTQHFGFVCRDSNATDSYACYVFKCESGEIAQEVVNAIKQAFIAHAELVKKSRERSPNMSCDHCPMLWYHRLCHDLEGMPEKKAHAFILRRIEQLAPEEQESLIAKYQAATAHIYEVAEHNSFLMMLLRAHCEARQQRHVHDTAENRSEFLNQYLGGSTIFMKAKRSLSSGFDNLLKRRSSRDDLNLKKEPSPLPTLITESSPEPNTKLLSPERQRSKSMSPAILSNCSDSETPLQGVVAPPPSANDDAEQEKESGDNSSMINIFLKVSDRGGHSADADGTWRQAIYNQVVTAPTDDELSSKTLLSIPSQPKGKRTKEELRQLWKMAIQQTILLVRMENENARLKEKEATSAVRRIKLEYVELGACDAGVQLMWDSLLSMARQQPSARVDRHMLTQAVMRGVPRMSRGSIWYFLAEQAALRSPPPDVRQYPLYHTPYHTILAGLTKHQHAILIDLGRTFPQHSYFASALGPGQLALYNVLKAYSLLDPDVGYCQGLSFVAGVLLLHMEETEAFVLLRHLMFRRGLRKQYLPDMSALQVQMYQLSRLLRDHEPELHARLETLEISPALYAAPWMLTLFTSQFPLGFVVRVFDLIFLESLDVVFSLSLALLSAHKDGLMLCESCEEAAEYLKHKLPDVDNHIYDKVMKKVHALDIRRQLSEYAVEYAVLKEEMPRLNALVEENCRLQAERCKMCHELDSAMEGLTNYQTTQTRLEFQNKTMEQQLQLLSKYVATHTRQELPPDIKKIVNNYNKRTTFGSKIFSSKFTNNDEHEDTRKNLSKTGTSTPNLFSKITKEDLMNAMRDEKKSSPESDRKHFLMKKSLSVQSGLIARQPLRILEENENDAKNEEFNKTVKEKDNKTLKEKDAFSEWIDQERKFEKQLKRDFDENLKRLDTKVNKDYLDDLSVFQSRKSMSLNIQPVKDKMDSGFVTPITPDDKKNDSMSSLSHPLSDCDVNIKFECQSTMLKQIRPLKHNSNASSIDLKQA